MYINYQNISLLHINTKIQPLIINAHYFSVYSRLTYQSIIKVEAVDDPKRREV